MLCELLFDSSYIFNSIASATLVMAHSLCNNTKERKWVICQRRMLSNNRSMEFGCFCLNSSHILVTVLPPALPLTSSLHTLASRDSFRLFLFFLFHFGDSSSKSFPYSLFTSSVLDVDVHFQQGLRGLPCLSSG